MTFGFNGIPSIDRNRILEESEMAQKEIENDVSVSEDEASKVFDFALETAVLGQKILDQLNKKVNNYIPVPPEAGKIRAAILRRTDRIPEGKYIDFSLFAECLDMILKSRKIKVTDLVDFTGDPNVDTENYNIKQRVEIGDDLTTVDLFLAGLILPASYIASRMVAHSLVGAVPPLGALVGEAIAFMFLLGLDRLAIKAELEKRSITIVNGQKMQDYVDYLADNPKEIHKILKNADIPDSDKIGDYKAISTFALNYIYRTPTAEYDSWLAYQHISYSNHELERILEMASNYSSKWSFVAAHQFNINEYIRANAIRLDYLAQVPDQGTLEAGIKRNLMAMRGAWKQPIIQSIQTASYGYRNIISTLLNEWLPPFKFDLVNIPEIDFVLTINANKTLLCCLVRILGAFDPSALRLFAKILRLGAMGIQLNYRNIMSNYIYLLFNEFANAAVNAVTAVRDEVTKYIFAAFQKDSDLIDLILACTPVQELIFEILQQFNHLSNLLRRLLLQVGEKARLQEESFNVYLDIGAGRRSLLFIAELLDAIAIEIEQNSGILCIGRKPVPSQDGGKTSNSNEMLDPELTTQFILNFKTSKVPIVDFDKDFLEENNLGKTIYTKGKTFIIENSETIDAAQLSSLVNLCQDELSIENQTAIRERLKKVINGLS